MADMMTASEIAKMLGEPIHRVRYVIAHYQIEPAARASTVRLFADVQVAAIKDKLFNMRIQKSG